MSKKAPSLAKLFKQKILHYIVPFFGAIILKVIYITLKKKYIMPKELPQEPLIMAVWHGELGLPPLFYSYILRKYRPDLYILISEHKDGEYIANTMRYFGLNSVRGSSSRGGARVLLAAIKKIKDGSDIAITPDGPRGPRHMVQDGVVAIAKKSNSKIVALSVKYENYWEMKSWDKFQVPKPFSNATFYASEPFSLNELELKKAKELIKGKLLRYG